MCLRDADHPKLAEFRQRSDQMKNDAFAGRRVEVQTVDDRDVHQIVGSEPAVAFRFEIVRRVVTAWLAGGRQELSRISVVAVRNWSMRNGWVVPPFLRLTSMAR